MGLFDTIECEYALPLPEFTDDQRKDFSLALGGGEIDLKTVEWQTKDLDNMLDHYTIEDDGQVYVRASQWYESEDSPNGVKPELSEGIEKVERTAEVHLYNIFFGEEYDHWLDYKVTLWKGEVKEAELYEYKCEGNEERIEMQKNMEDMLKSQSKKKSVILKYLIGKPLSFARFILGSLINMTLRVERWLT